ncbi:MAG: 16S rRNA (cytosine(1402)-N(4))-methyltransferase RsmH [Bacteroidota bacterium]
MSYHKPVMLEECLEGLAIKPDGIYVDVTFGGGGHSRAINVKLTQGGHLLAFDQDSDARENAENWEFANFTFVPSNFQYLSKFLKLHGFPQVDGILADLGVSSHQLDAGERGFSFREEAELDMRMNQGQPLSAKTFLNETDEAELHRVFGMYGDIRNAKTLARQIVRVRAEQPLETTLDLKNLLEPLAPRRREFKYFAQAFQAVRIAVNDEMGVLESFLLQTPEVLKPEGRLVVMAYHSTEDRLVKSFIQKGKFKGELEQDLKGNILRPLEPITRKPLTASSSECEANPRARSAKLRIAQKNA